MQTQRALSDLRTTSDEASSSSATACASANHVILRRNNAKDIAEMQVIIIIEGEFQAREGGGYGTRRRKPLPPAMRVGAVDEK